MKGKKYSSNIQPNAPQLEHLLYSQTQISHQPLAQQPPHNPYYTDPINSSQSYPSPPAYSDLTDPSFRPVAVPLAQMSSTQIHYPRAMVSEAPSAVIVNNRHSSVNQYDRRREKYRRQAKKFGCELILTAILIVALSQAVLYLYSKRTCPDYVIQKFNKDFTLTYSDLKSINFALRSLAVALFILGFLKLLITGACSCLIGFAIGIVSMIGTLASGYLCYLAFYSPCYMGVNEVVSQLVKSAVSVVSNSVPGPDSGFFGEKNIIQTVQDDPQGVYIFGLDVGIFITFISTFFAGLG